MAKKLNEIFAKNRAEEFPDDLYGKYVLPRNYNSVDLRGMTKASIIIGGRGYGKTMFLKYHCHPTLLSIDNDNIELKDIQTIGLYWRPDTSFTQHMSEKWLGKFWPAVFKTYMSLSLLIDLSNFINNLTSKKSPVLQYKDKILNIAIPRAILEALDISESINLSASARVLQNKLFTLCNWINAPFSEIPPFNIETKPTLELIIEEINEACPILNSLTYHVFVDEFENLTTSQQEIINTLMKHGKPPLLFSVAYKKNAQVSHKTLSDEKVVEQHDYRVIDLESLYINEFDIFSGEILALRFAELTLPNEIIESLKGPLLSKSGISTRKSIPYQDAIKNLANMFLPEYTTKEISTKILNDEPLKKKLENLIYQGIRNENDKFKTSSFIDLDYPEATLVNAVLLNRKNINGKVILDEFTKYKNGDDSKYKHWIPNNLVGVILYLYNLFPTKNCPIYAGHKQFAKISRGNIRHFLELCHQSVLRAEITQKANEQSTFTLNMDIDTQSYATKKTSEFEIEKISDFGAHGIHLKRIAKRIGRIFNYSQSRKSQSESEVNHFTLDMSDISSLNETTRLLLNEALVWSVLIEQDSTKSKTDDTLEEKDYLLHPVLSPYFGISYRKKRKIKFSVNEIDIIFTGEDSKFSELLKKYRKKWAIDEDNNLDDEFIGVQLGLL